MWSILFSCRFIIFYYTAYLYSHRLIILKVIASQLRNLFFILPSYLRTLANECRFMNHSFLSFTFPINVGQNYFSLILPMVQTNPKHMAKKPMNMGIPTFSKLP